MKKTEDLVITDRRMLELMEFTITKGKVGTKAEFLASIGANPRNQSNYQTGHQRFTVDMIRKAAEVYGIDTNWFFGFSARMKSNLKDLSTIELLKLAVSEAEKELAKKK
ncbi:hypothetical protein SAMN05444266_101652 [Chitinophaga jiangningensis]|uniref:Uncharacterized protein n=1 Tax=Chitinophaga jiangningensis TaxID=1419482 RepID=A0A1M6WJW8_9BACT|nr:hypothetical protein [Chitinophaga jiangningensis]SHK93889.1 hypothetical protein SAMN05444266_101652 [Chitinophaga jiangningensis]